MKNTITRLRLWLTDARRQALHAALGTLATLGVTAGLLSDSQSAAIVGLAGSALALTQGALSLALLRGSEAAQWFDVTGRGLVYGFAAAGGAAGLAFGLWGDDTVAHVAQLVAVGLAVVSSFLGVVNVQTVPKDAEGRPLTRREHRATIAA
ncbi:hypothetical protein A9Z40_03190 [Microbacterium arborescens]|uniref:Holin n=1 Tax=Microbacterium arborescens TaxID=33883 RepID=A0ABX2WIC1_9MICO|nr:hypothetical protein [Microbacterium arborescens]OAZ40960.1 hypothetical protein A9Z40_03190 [Microbacterium arborescens]